MPDILRSYFQGFSFPHNAVTVLAAGLRQDWAHPICGQSLGPAPKRDAQGS